MSVRRAARLTAVMVAAGLVPLLPSAPAHAGVIAPLEATFNKQVQGDFTIVSNGVMVCPAPTVPAYPATPAKAPCLNAAQEMPDAFTTRTVNDHYPMRYADVDADPATYNSSSAQLTIPAGAAVEFAQLTWAGSTGTAVDSSGNDLADRCSAGSAAEQKATKPAGSPQSQAVRLRVGGAPGVDVTPRTFVSEPRPAAGEPAYYSARADVRQHVAKAPVGSPVTITVGNVWAPTGTNCFGGWALTVVYAFPQGSKTALRHVYIYNGHVRQGKSDADTATTVSGFKYAGGEVRAGVVAYEGDSGIPGDQFLVNGSNMIEAPGKPADNFFTSTAEGRLAPDWSNNFSIDGKDFAIPAGVITPGETSANLTFRTSGDSYLAQQVVLSVPVPHISVAKHVCTAVDHTTCAPKAGVSEAGPEPWALTHSVDHGSVVHWRITATNTGSTAITGATLADPAEPSCETAAGRFDLAVGEAKVFHCKTESVTGPLTNTVTAQFTPSGREEPELEPIRSKPASARVRIKGQAAGGQPLVDSGAALGAGDRPGGMPLTGRPIGYLAGVGLVMAGIGALMVLFVLSSRREE